MKKITLLQKFKYANQEDMNKSFLSACETGNLKIVQYLLTNSEIGRRANIHAENDFGFCWACLNGYLDIVKYLLTSPELNEHANIHAANDFSFKKICEKNHLEIINFLIIDYNIKKTPIIDSFVKTSFPEVDKMFNSRELNEKLNKELKIKFSTKKIKI